MTPNLAYDVGMNNGDDTAYYLARGYNVVAIEADPSLVEAARARFGTAIMDGRLTVLHYAVGEDNTTADFWICPEETVWNSFNRALASRKGLRHYAVQVPVRRFSDILREHGVPEFLKIDIEGHDHFCLRDINPDDRPRVVSWEMSTPDDLVLMKHKGYNAFKCISQLTFTPLQLGARRGTVLGSAKFTPMGRLRQMARSNLAVRAAFRAARSALFGGPPAPPHAGGVLTAEWPGGRWTFPFGSSGPIGPDLPGAWKSLEQVLYEYLDYWLNTGALTPVDDRDWFDIHATCLPPGEAPESVTSLG